MEGRALSFDQPVQVAIRLRPLEEGQHSLANNVDSNSVSLEDDTSGLVRVMKFDKVFGGPSTQEEVFEIYGRPTVNRFLDGFNSSVFCYGQTGSGKTYTIFGDKPENKGLVPRCLEFLFEEIALRSNFGDTSIYIQFIELYNDNIIDLLKGFDVENFKSVQIINRMSYLNDSLRHKLGNVFDIEDTLNTVIFDRKLNRSVEIPDMYTMASGNQISEHKSANDGILRSSKDGRVYVEGCDAVLVRCLSDITDLLMYGISKRETHPTSRNMISSRSHAVLNIFLSQKPTAGTTKVSQLSFVDLAGSERLNPNEKQDKERLFESKNINSTLSALGQCVSALRNGRPHVPFRDAKLTRLLSNVLSGNCITTLIATLNPLKAHHQECLSTLHFAQGAGSLHNTPHVNFRDVEPDDYEKKLEDLMKENAMLRKENEELEAVVEQQSKQVQQRIEARQPSQLSHYSSFTGEQSISRQSSAEGATLQIPRTMSRGKLGKQTSMASIKNEGRKRREGIMETRIQKLEEELQRRERMIQDLVNEKHTQQRSFQAKINSLKLELKQAEGSISKQKLSTSRLLSESNASFKEQLTKMIDRNSLLLTKNEETVKSRLSLGSLSRPQTSRSVLSMSSRLGNITYRRPMTATTELSSGSDLFNWDIDDWDLPQSFFDEYEDDLYLLSENQRILISSIIGQVKRSHDVELEKYKKWIKVQKLQLVNAERSFDDFKEKQRNKYVKLEKRSNYFLEYIRRTKKILNNSAVGHRILVEDFPAFMPPK
ncbi:hypothetical protein PCE1_004070 [Barthelona sp. PCE]